MLRIGIASLRSSPLSPAVRHMSTVLLQPRLRLAVNAWSGFAADRRDAKASMCRMATHWQSHDTHRAWRAWRLLVARQRRLVRSVAHNLRFGTGRALAAWREAALELRESRQRAAGALRSLGPRGRAMRRAFNAWSPRSGERALQRTVSTIALTSQLHRRRRTVRSCLAILLVFRAGRAERPQRTLFALCLPPAALVAPW